MKVKTKEITKIVGLLVDPEPGWMALVTNGANQTPFNSLKSEDGQRQEHQDMATKGKGAKRKGTLTRINFSKTNFPKQEDAQKYVDDNGIVDCEITDDGDVWAAKSTALDGLDLEKPTQQRGKDAGVTLFVAADKVADDTTVEEPEVDAADKPKEDVTAKAATKVKQVDGEPVVVAKAEGEEDDKSTTDTELRFPANKYDYWAGMMSDSGSLLGVLKDGTDYDGVPPGMDEVVGALYYSTGNVLGSSEPDTEKKAKLTQIGEDYATLAMGLYELFNQAVEDSTKSADPVRQEKAANFLNAFRDSVKRAKGGEMPIMPGVNVSTEPTNKTKSVVVVDIAEADPDNTPLSEMAQALGKIAERLDTIENTVKGAGNRTQTRRNDDTLIESLSGDGEDDDEPDADEAMQAEKVNALRLAMGGRKVQPARNH